MNQVKPLTKKNHLHSLREYIEALREIGELVEVEREVDWNLEIGAITRRVNELGAPAPLFTNIKGFAPGFRVLGTPAGISSAPGRYLSRVALSLGLPPTASGREIIEALIEARHVPGIAPRIVESGPCLARSFQRSSYSMMTLMRAIRTRLSGALPHVHARSQGNISLITNPLVR